MATARHKHQRTGARSPLRLAAGATALAVCLLVLSAVLFPVAPAQATVAKGMCDGRIQDSSCDQTELLTPISEVGDDLRVGWVRLILNWPRIEPTRGVYNETELARLDYVIGELRARNVKVLLTICYMPAWASDQSFWDSPPMGYSKGYQVFYPIKDGCLDDLGRTGEYLASRFAGKANAYEVWNEPNLWPYIYPQRTASDPDFAARTYLKMLKAYSAGIRRGDPTALILAGATAPMGTNNVWRTSPQTFARYLQRPRRGAVLRRLLAPSVHAGRLGQQGARSAPERHEHHRHAVQPGTAAAPLPRQALLPDRVRLQHGLVERLRRDHGEQGAAGGLAAQGVQLRGALPAR